MPHALDTIFSFHQKAIDPFERSLSIQPIHKYPMRKPKASEAHRVAQQIAAIRAALHKHGYQIRKRPKQAAWTITPLNPPKTTPPLARGSGRKLTPPSATRTQEKLTPPLATRTEEKLTPPLARGAGGVMQETTGTHTTQPYLLTYQPAPISAWVLNPQTNNPDCQTIQTIIQKAITRSAS
ncbi:MAG TPA: hypothetical protein V6D14_16485 [Coleofasciculaceae cyanobacterium]|jgi:hypothetical protein